MQSIGADILGFGPIERFMADPEVTEVMVNGDDSIYIERAGRLYLTDSRFVVVEHLRRSSNVSSSPSVAGSTSPRQWSMPVCPTAPA